MITALSSLAEALDDAREAASDGSLVCDLDPACDDPAVGLSRDPIHGWLPSCSTCAFVHGSAQRPLRRCGASRG